MDRSFGQVNGPRASRELTRTGVRYHGLTQGFDCQTTMEKCKCRELLTVVRLTAATDRPTSPFVGSVSLEDADLSLASLLRAHDLGPTSGHR